jgi:DNA-binding GntR family transcriptional regulator
LRLSTLLRIGRTPVHQALDRLMIEGMVAVIPRKGVIVKPVSLNEVLQIIEVRLINEPLGARLAAQQANEADLAALSDVLGRAKHWDDAAGPGISSAHRESGQERRADRTATNSA